MYAHLEKANDSALIIQKIFLGVDNSAYLVESQVPAGKRISRTGQEGKYMLFKKKIIIFIIMFS